MGKSNIGFYVFLGWCGVAWIMHKVLTKANFRSVNRPNKFFETWAKEEPLTAGDRWAFVAFGICQIINMALVTGPVCAVTYYFGNVDQELFNFWEANLTSLYGLHLLLICIVVALTVPRDYDNRNPSNEQSKLTERQCNRHSGVDLTAQPNNNPKQRLLDNKEETSDMEAQAHAAAVPSTFPVEQRGFQCTEFIYMIGKSLFGILCVFGPALSPGFARLHKKEVFAGNTADEVFIFCLNVVAGMASSVFVFRLVTQLKPTLIRFQFHSNNIYSEIKKYRTDKMRGADNMEEDRKDREPWSSATLNKFDDKLDRLRVDIAREASSFSRNFGAGAGFAAVVSFVTVILYYADRDSFLHEPHQWPYLLLTAQFSAVTILSFGAAAQIDSDMSSTVKIMRQLTYGLVKTHRHLPPLRSPTINSNDHLIVNFWETQLKGLYISILGKQVPLNVSLRNYVIGTILGEALVYLWPLITDYVSHSN